MERVGWMKFWTNEEILQKLGDWNNPKLTEKMHDWPFKGKGTPF